MHVPTQLGVCFLKLKKKKVLGVLQNYINFLLFNGNIIIPIMKEV